MLNLTLGVRLESVSNLQQELPGFPCMRWMDIKFKAENMLFINIHYTLTI